MTDLQQETAQHGEHSAPVEAWDAIAALYDKHVAPGEADLATAGLRLAGLQAGDTFLDVAAGPGGLSLPAARLARRCWPPTGPQDDRALQRTRRPKDSTRSRDGLPRARPPRRQLRHHRLTVRRDARS